MFCVCRTSGNFLFGYLCFLKSVINDIPDFIIGFFKIIGNGYGVKELNCNALSEKLISACYNTRNNSRICFVCHFYRSEFKRKKRSSCIVDLSLGEKSDNLVILKNFNCTFKCFLILTFSTGRSSMPRAKL